MSTMHRRYDTPRGGPHGRLGFFVLQTDITWWEVSKRSTNHLIRLNRPLALETVFPCSYRVLLYYS